MRPSSSHCCCALDRPRRQIILTSDRPPSEIPGLEARLVSRFQWGMVADIDLPDLEHRSAILRKKAELDHLEQTIPDDVIRFIAENVRSNVRELEGSIIRLLAYASLKHRDITVDIAREALRDKLRNGDDAGSPRAAQLDPTAIQAAVAKEWGVTPEGLRSKTRTKTLTVPRQRMNATIRVGVCARTSVATWDCNAATWLASTTVRLDGKAAIFPASVLGASMACVSAAP